jgi:uncharacterized protein YbaR (Trm112 family)
MKMELMPMLVCPSCRGKLKLEVVAADGDEVTSGRLDCTGCGLSYPIDDGIPNLLPPELRGND